MLPIMIWSDGGDPGPNSICAIGEECNRDGVGVSGYTLRPSKNLHISCVGYCQSSPAGQITVNVDVTVLDVTDDSLL